MGGEKKKSKRTRDSTGQSPPPSQKQKHLETTRSDYTPRGVPARGTSNIMSVTRALNDVSFSGPTTTRPGHSSLPAYDYELARIDREGAYYDQAQASFSGPAQPPTRSQYDYSSRNPAPPSGYARQDPPPPYSTVPQNPPPPQPSSQTSRSQVPRGYFAGFGQTQPLGTQAAQAPPQPPAGTTWVGIPQDYEGSLDPSDLEQRDPAYMGSPATNKIQREAERATRLERERQMRLTKKSSSPSPEPEPRPLTKLEAKRKELKEEQRIHRRMKDDPKISKADIYKQAERIQTLNRSIQRLEKKK